MGDRTVAVVAFDGLQTLDLVGPWECFHGANRQLDAQPAPGPRYRLALLSEAGGPVRSESGLLLAESEPIAGCGTVDTLIVVGGGGVRAACQQADLLHHIGRLAGGARRVCSVCTGAFLLASAGALPAGSRVTTHWARAAALARAHGELDVDPDPIFLRSGRVWTSAGVTAGMDLSLALIEHDHGPAVAQTVARWLVLFLRRPGGQSQFATALWSEPAEREPIRVVQDHIHRQPDADLSVPALARLAGMSERNFTRVFTRELGEPPGRYVERVRLEAARRLLEQSSSALPVVASRCGFGSAEQLRRAFQRNIGVAPAGYRQRFSVGHRPAPTRGVNR
jgi:transcriptional regulator GlxA family with amidase domain